MTATEIKNYIIDEYYQNLSDEELMEVMEEYNTDSKNDEDADSKNNNDVYELDVTEIGTGKINMYDNTCFSFYII